MLRCVEKVRECSVGKGCYIVVRKVGDCSVEEGCCTVVGKVEDCSIRKECGCNYCNSSKVTCYDWHFIQSWSCRSRYYC
jgi:hypothetical protein